MRKNYDAIDIVKFIMAIIVILVHTYPFYYYNETLGFISSNVIGRLVIPFYFTVSGYLFYKGLKKGQDKYYKNYIKKLIKLYIKWSLILLPFGLLFISKYTEINIITIVGYTIIGIFYSGTYYHLWYMIALILSIIIVYYLSKKLNIKYILLIGFILQIIGLTETYFGLFSNTMLSGILESYYNTFYTSRNFLFFALFYVSLGCYIYEYQRNIKYLFSKCIILLIVLVSEGFIVKHYQVALDYNMYITNILLTYYFVNYLLNIELHLNINYINLRIYGVLLYFSHGIFLELIPLLFNDLYTNYGSFRFFSVTICSFITSYIIKKYYKGLF